MWGKSENYWSPVPKSTPSRGTGGIYGFRFPQNNSLENPPLSPLLFMTSGTCRREREAAGAMVRGHRAGFRHFRRNNRSKLSGRKRSCSSA